METSCTGNYAAEAACRLLFEGQRVSYQTGEYEARKTITGRIAVKLVDRVDVDVVIDGVQLCVRCYANSVRPLDPVEQLVVPAAIRPKAADQFLLF